MLTQRTKVEPLRGVSKGATIGQHVQHYAVNGSAGTRPPQTNVWRQQTQGTTRPTLGIRPSAAGSLSFEIARMLLVASGSSEKPLEEWSTKKYRLTSFHSKLEEQFSGN